MTKSELIERLATMHPALTHADISEAVSVILDAITASLAAGDRVEIRGFGSFAVNRRPSRIGRNPKTGESVRVPEKFVPHFKTGRELRQRVQIRQEDDQRFQGTAALAALS